MFSNPSIALVKMAVEYTRHALSRMRQRKISKRMVEDALKRPDLSYVTRRGRVASLKRHGDKFLKVILRRVMIKYVLLQFIGQGGLRSGERGIRFKG